MTIYEPHSQISGNYDCPEVDYVLYCRAVRRFIIGETMTFRRNFQSEQSRQGDTTRKEILHMTKSPEMGDLQKDLKEFFSHKYGAQVQFAQPEKEGAASDSPTEEIQLPDIKFEMKPEELEAYLNNYVIRQNEAKEILATKICTHFNRIRLQEDDEPVGNIKNNIILIGPTGVGKTYLIKLIASHLGVPFVKGDATRFSETGYVGGDVDELVRSLVHEADGNIKLAEYGIVYIDEIDKIASSGNVMGPDVSRTGVQRTLLKLMEDTDVDLQAPHDLTSQMENALQFQKTGKVEKKRINTRNILFIVSGAFANLEEIIKKRMSVQTMGFEQGTDVDTPEMGEWLPHVTAEDLIEYGFESEFIGRLPVNAVLHKLGIDDLFQILVNPNSPVVIAKKLDFKAYDIDVDFDEASLRLIAEKAHESGTGARGLVGVMEKILIKFEKKLPSSTVKRFSVTTTLVKYPERELERILAEAPVQSFEHLFFEEHGITLTLDPTAAACLADVAEKHGKTTEEMGMELFKDYAHGLKLIQARELKITEEAIRNPEEYLDGLIKKFYETQARTK